jgi:hypothetical protein
MILSFVGNLSKKGIITIIKIIQILVQTIADDFIFCRESIEKRNHNNHQNHTNPGSDDSG